MTVIGRAFMEDDMNGKNPRKVEVVFLVGSAAVGKTSVREELGKISSREIKVHEVMSSTRGTYARLKIKTEKDATKMNYQDRLHLQSEIYVDYLGNVRTKVEEAALEATRDAYSQRLHVVAIDRSPFDHIVYSLLDLTQQPLSNVFESLGLATKLLDHIKGIHTYFGVKVDIGINYAMFDYPQSWMLKSTKDVHDDGFRVSTSARNYVWSLALTSMLRMNSVGFDANHLTFNSSDELTAKQRADAIIDMVVHKNGQ